MEPLALAVEYHAPHEQRDDLKRVPLADHLVDPKLNVVAVEHRRALLKLRELVSDRLALRHQLIQLRSNRVRRTCLSGEVHHARLLALVIREALTQRVHGVEVVGQRGLLLLHHEIGDDARHVVGIEERTHLLGDRAFQLLLRDYVTSRRAAVVRVLPPALAVPAAALVAVAVHIEQLAGKQVLHSAPPLPRAQRELALHAVEQLAVDDGGHAVFDPRTAVLVDARVLLVAQHLRDRAHVERLAHERAPRPQGIHYLREAAAGIVHLEHGAHHTRLLLVDVVEAVAAEVEAVDPHAVVLALEGVAVQSALHVLREVRRVVLRHTLKHGLQQDAVRAIFYALRSRDHAHAVALELRLVDRAVVPVAGEAVGLVDVDLLEPPARAVRHHLRERSAVVRRGAGGRSVGVHAHDAVAVAARLLRADAHLVLYRLLALTGRGVTRVDNRACHIMVSPPARRVGIFAGASRRVAAHMRGALFRHLYMTMTL